MIYRTLTSITTHMEDAKAKTAYLSMVLRPPYVKKGDVVIHVGKPGSGGFTGGIIARDVIEYPQAGCYVVAADLYGHIQHFLDHDLSCTIKDVPRNFWRLPFSRRFNNIHAYINHKRRVKERRRERMIRKMLAS